MFDIEEELKKLPDQPGVYIMHDSEDIVIYVGKAVNLKNRVKQYFQKSRKRTEKINKMVSRIKRFEYIITDSEVEALILECNLIKEYSPKYNTMLTDDKTYPYIKVTVNEDYPRVIFTRRIKRDGAKYFGPYVSAGAIKDTIDLLEKIYRIRTCNRDLSKTKGRACINYQMKICSGPCINKISKEDYRANVDKVIEFLGGNYDNVVKMLTADMNKASDDMEYEEAARLRDLINEVKAVSTKQKVSFGNFGNRDIVAYAEQGDDVVFQIFFIRNGKVIGRDHTHVKRSPLDTGDLLTDFIKQYYGNSPYVPDEILVSGEVDDRENIEKWLSGIGETRRVKIITPLKGEKHKLVELAEKNAEIILKQDKEKITREEKRTKGALKELDGLLDMPYTKRIESYDISDINGFDNVASMVVYEDGKPKKNEYRKFKIKWHKGADDYASLREVLTRRFEHGIKERQELKEKGIDNEYGKFSKFPDLILMDGGRGQVNVALEVLENMGLNIPVCGMVKDDRHRTRGLFYNNIEIEINSHSEAFYLITRIQDETHRFAIEFHRNTRSKNQVKSVLDDINGVGDKRRRALMKYFKSIENIRNASLDELNDVPGMDKRTAENVYNYFH